MELLFIILQEEDMAGLSRALVRNRIPATKFATEGLYLSKKNVTLMICIDKAREEEVFGYIRENCTERLEEREVMEYNGSFMESVHKQVAIGGATVFIVDVDRMLRF